MMGVSVECTEAEVRWELCGGYENTEAVKTSLLKSGSVFEEGQGAVE